MEVATEPGECVTEILARGRLPEPLCVSIPTPGGSHTKTPVTKPRDSHGLASGVPSRTAQGPVPIPVRGPRTPGPAADNTVIAVL